MGMVFSGEQYLTTKGLTVDFANMTTNNRYVSTQQVISGLSHYNNSQINSMLKNTNQGLSYINNSGNGTTQGNSSIPYIQYIEYAIIGIAITIAIYVLIKHFKK